MELMKIGLLLVIIALSSNVYADVWFFPPSLYLQNIMNYKDQYEYSSKFIEDFEKLNTEFGDYPFFTSDDTSFYIGWGGYNKIDRKQIDKNDNGYLEFLYKEKKIVVIEGGGYFASSLSLYDGYKNAINPQLETLRKDLVGGRVGPLYGPLLDFALIMPQVIKDVNMSAPFLTETVHGKQVTYDDDMLKYRWFFYAASQIFGGAFFVNDPTPMVEGSPGNGKGLTLDVDFHIPVDNLVVLNGFVDLERQHLYRLNARMKKVKVTGDDFEFDYDFEDYVHFAQIDFPQKVDHVRLTVLDTYDGEKWDDMAISGLFVNPDVLHTRNSDLARKFFNEAKQKYEKAPLKSR